MTKQMMETSIDEFNGRTRRRKRLLTAFAICAVAIAALTAYLLIMPGVTMEQREAVCGKVEHAHSAACYEQKLVCGLPEGESIHVHGPSCYSKDGKLICTITPAGHMHVDGCFAKGGELKCTESDPAHVHGPECYAKEGDLICTAPEVVHMHRDSCYDANGVLTCKVDLPHVHGDRCHNEKGELTCTLAGVGHVHSDEYIQRVMGLVCTNDEPSHVHSAQCAATADALACVQDEPITFVHQHDDSCYERVLVCGLEEHSHDEVCYDAETYQMIQSSEANKAKLEAEDEKAKDAEGAVETDAKAGEVSGSFENDYVKVDFEVPESVEGDVELFVDGQKILSTGNGHSSVDGQEAESEVADSASSEADGSAAVAGDGEPASDGDVLAVEPQAAEPQEDGDQAGPDSSIDEAEQPVSSDASEPTQVASSDAVQAEPASGTAGSAPEFAARAANSDAEDQDALWVTKLNMSATINGEPVSDLSSLGMTAKIAVKDSAVASLLGNAGTGDASAQITVTQTPAVVEGTALSEVPEGQVDSIVLTGNEAAVLDVPVVASVMSVQANELGNPKFTVEYYGMLQTVAEDADPASGNDALQVINVSKAGLPTNANKGSLTGNNVVNMQLSEEGGRYHVTTESKETKIFTDEAYDFFGWYTLERMNKLRDSEFYELVGVKVKQPGQSDFTYYESTAVEFTNNPVNAGGNTILIQDGTVVRLIYAPVAGSYANTVQYYDYDISDGKLYTDANFTASEAKQTSAQAEHEAAGKTSYANTYRCGINSDANYSGGGVKYGFGNGPTSAGVDTSISEAKNGGTYINRAADGATNIIQKCSFGLVTSIDANGNPVFANGIVAPDLFGNGDAVGKTVIANEGSDALLFNRSGDTYEIYGAQLDGSQVLSGLNTFGKMGVWGLSISQYPNDFWVLDQADTFGADGHDIKFGNNATTIKDRRKGSGGYSLLAESTVDHNSYFGMQGQINFHLTADYAGPLNYYFFGDDDMWVFLVKTDEAGNMIPGTDELICDIGGVHQTTGSYIDLRSKLPVGREGHYALRFYYTERGAGGSTCYMRFTLPSVSCPNPPLPTGSVRVYKQVDAADGSEAYDQEYEFKATFFKDASGTELSNNYYLARYNNNGTLLGFDVIASGGTFKLKHNEYAIINYLPLNATYSIEEVSPGDEFQVSYAHQSNGVVTTSEGDDTPLSFEGGQITASAASSRLVFTNKLTYELPATGGAGTAWFFAGGAVLVCAGAMLLVRKRLRRS